ncbi:MAG: hypothetical protein MUD01_15195 [Chloroflexaceae bacterium]|jgi:hypothetical protein|nr:hypothetical protein [Chloroflexaceae bacterium]
MFDTRTFATIQGVYTESITAGGRYWDYDANSGAFLRSGNLRDVSRYANGPCQRFIGTCSLGTRTYLTINGVYTESITTWQTWSE